MKFTLRDSIGKKIYTLVGITLIICVIISVVGIVSANVIDRALVLTRAERDHTVNLDHAILHFYQYIAEKDPQLLSEFENQIEIAINMSGIFGSLREDRKNRSKREIATELSRWAPSMNYNQTRDIITIVDLLPSNKLVVFLLETAANAYDMEIQYRSLARQYDNSEDPGARANIITQMSKLENDIKQLTVAFSAGVGDLSRWAIKLVNRILWGALLFLVVISLILAVFIIRSIVRPLFAVVDLSKKVADGDFTQRLQLDTKDETQLLSKTINQVSENLNKMVGEIRKGTTELASTISEISATATQLAASASETSSSVSQISSTAEEVRQTAKVSNEKAGHVNQRAEQTATISEKGTKNISDTIDGMSQIRDEMTSIADGILKLSEQSQNISEITNTVNDISEQSKLLSVNASVEAAKAGDFGKGFTVVAQEIKSLASQSKKASKQISDILQEIVQSTNETVLATERGRKVVDSGVKLSVQSGDSIKILADSISDSAEAALQIKSSSQQQLAGLDQLLQGMTGIDQASRQNMEGAKQLEKESKNLANLADRLKKMTDRFKV